MEKKKKKVTRNKEIVEKTEKEKLKFELRIGVTPSNEQFLEEEAIRLKLKPNDIINRWLDYLRSRPQGERIFYLYPEIVEVLEAEIEEKIEAEVEKRLRSRQHLDD